MLGWTDPRPLTEFLPAKEVTAFRGLGIHTVEELLQYYPRTWTDGFIEGTITKTHSRTSHSGDLIYTVTIDGLEAVFFRARYIAKILTEGTRVLLHGKYENGRLVHPDFLVGGKGSFSVASYPDFADMVRGRRILPIYPAKKRMNTWRIMAGIYRVLDQVTIQDSLGATMSLSDALCGIHRPDTDPTPAVLRLKYDEALSLALVMALRRADTTTRKAPAITSGDLYERQVARLPFELTEDQKRVLHDISTDMASTVPMRRLLQGEVGSGKTVVALLAMLRCVEAGKQCAMLAPTEVLVAQHAASIRAFTEGRCNIVSLTGAMTTSERKAALLNIMSGGADIIIGTHALIQDTVEFYDLGLVVVDEQHRFGVDQRDRLLAKGDAHLLVMTATPIPRTVAITVFGDLTISTMKAPPRPPVATSVVPENRPRWIERAWERMREEIRTGHQVFVVCPRIEGDGGVLEVGEHLRSLGFDLGVLHGKLPQEEKDAVMEAFINRSIPVLVATTVIEVGVDVPNATMMMIREAENFGISQLHQLRGRVGRGAQESLCLLHTLSEPGSPTYERLEIVARCNDGFELAEYDLEQRQEGDVLGTHQSGRGQLKTLNLRRDLEIIQIANRDAEAMVAQDRDRARALVASFRDTAYLEKT